MGAKRLLCWVVGHRWHIYHSRFLRGGVGVDPVAACLTCGARKSA